MAMRVVSLASLAGCASAHGGIVTPPARDQTGHGLYLNPSDRDHDLNVWFNQGCQINCKECKGHVPFLHSLRLCEEEMDPTLDPALHTFFPTENYRFNPWAAPGHSPVFSPCGISAGQSEGVFVENGAWPAPGYPIGFDGRNISGGPVTVWPIGSVQEVSWQIYANHGGGYAVRLCPLASEQTEECFQEHHLPFEGDSTWIQFGGNPTDRTEIRANRTTTGTKPSGSQWTKVPIPACSGGAGGAFGCTDACDAPQFESPIPGVWGLGKSPSYGCAGCNKHCGLLNPHCNRDHCKKIMDYEIVDHVKVPDLPAGDYALSFRWDSEQTPQIWTQCANIQIVSQALI